MAVASDQRAYCPIGICECFLYEGSHSTAMCDTRNVGGLVQQKLQGSGAQDLHPEAYTSISQASRLLQLCGQSGPCKCRLPKSSQYTPPTCKHYSSIWLGTIFMQFCVLCYGCHPNEHSRHHSSGHPRQMASANNIASGVLPNSGYVQPPSLLWPRAAIGNKHELHALSAAGCGVLPFQLRHYIQHVYV